MYNKVEINKKKSKKDKKCNSECANKKKKEGEGRKEKKIG